MMRLFQLNKKRKGDYSVWHVMQWCVWKKSDGRPPNIAVILLVYLQFAERAIAISVQLDDLINKCPRPNRDPWSTSGDLYIRKI